MEVLGIVQVSGDETRITISMQGHEVVLHLVPSQAVSEKLIQQVVNSSDQIDDFAVLAGHIVDVPDAWARITLINNVLTGSIKLNDALYDISHEVTNSPDGESPLSTVKYHLTLPKHAANHRSVVRSPLTSQLDRMRQAPPAQVAAPPERTLYRLSDNPVHTAIRIGLVIDSLYNEKHGGNGHANALSIVNTVDGIYQDQLGVAVILESMVLFDDPDTDPMRDVQGNIDDFLNAFRTVRITEPRLNNDLTLVHLLTGLKDPDNVIGLGWIGTACRTDGYDVSISAPFAFDGLLAAHEMAHNLGALHDNQTSCPGDSSDIMWPRLSSRTTTHFSACSKQAMSSGIDASCNIDNIDMSIGLGVLAADTELQYRLSVMVTNDDSTRSVDGVSSMIRLPPGTVVAFQDSRCTAESDGIYCLHGSVLPNQTDVIHMLITYPDNLSQMVVADILPSYYSDVNIANNRATLEFNPSDDEIEGATFEPEPVAIPSKDQSPYSGGSGATLWLILLLLLRQIAGLQSVRKSACKASGQTPDRILR